MIIQNLPKTNPVAFKSKQNPVSQTPLSSINNSSQVAPKGISMIYFTSNLKTPRVDKNLVAVNSLNTLDNEKRTVTSEQQVEGFKKIVEELSATNAPETVEVPVFEGFATVEFIKDVSGVRFEMFDQQSNVLARGSVAMTAMPDGTSRPYITVTHKDPNQIQETGTCDGVKMALDAKGIPVLDENIIDPPYLVNKLKERIQASFDKRLSAKANGLNLIFTQGQLGKVIVDIMNSNFKPVATALIEDTLYTNNGQEVKRPKITILKAEEVAAKVIYDTIKKACQ